MIIVEFFRDVFDGIWYFPYLLLCIFLFFYVLGIVADNKREKINKKLKEKKTYDIESGREAAIAALESKQVLAVNEEENKADNNNSNNELIASTIPEEKKEEPTVVVKDTLPPLEPVVQPVTSPMVTPMEQAMNEEPLVINSNQQ